MRISIFGLRRPGTGEMLRLLPSISPCHLTVPLAAPSAPPSVRAMTLPYREGSASCEPEAAREGRPGTNRLISVGDIRVLFKLGRTAAYELTHRPGFPAPVQISSRCLRWWASEVATYADALQREGAQRRTRRATTRVVEEPGGAPSDYRDSTSRPQSQGGRLTVLATPGSVPDRPVIELEHGITVYPARTERGRWRAVWYEDGERQQCEAVTEEAWPASWKRSPSGSGPTRRT